MASKYRISYPWRICLMLLGVTWLTIANLVGFQYIREKQYKADLFNTQLQMFNRNILDCMNEGLEISSILNTLRPPMAGLRVSVIGHDGQVIFDSSSDSLISSNHSTRPEIKAAIQKGSGYSVRRVSQSTGDSYFYSATKGDAVIIRTAAPYSVDLLAILEADNTFLWFMLFVTIVISTIGYFVSRKLGQTISRLNRFAEKAERGERIYDNEAFPHDELGDIANNIVRLYARLQQATAENDRQHQLALQQEQDKIRLKKELTNNINHELKTPVASIQVCLETILSHPNLSPEKQREFIERCYANTDRLRKLLNDVSLITRIDDGNTIISKDLVDLRTIIEEVCADSELMARNKDIEIKTDISQKLEMRGNMQMLQSIFRNLIDNAIAYSGGNLIEIRLEDADSSKIKLIVSDNGVGIAKENLPHIFERFYRVDKGRSRQIGGTGLGLAIVKNAVMIHGGSIDAENRSTGGLLFRIVLARM